MKNKFNSTLLTLLLLSTATYSQVSDRVLFVIDMQTNLLMHGKGGIHVDSLQTGPLIKNVNTTIYTAQSLGIPVFYILNEWTNPLVNFFTHNACKKGSAGTELDRRIAVVDSLFFKKSAGNSFSNAQLSDYVKRYSIKTIYITGIMAEGCVAATVTQGLKRGLDMRLIVPAIGSSSRSKLEKSLDSLKRQGAKTIQKIEERPEEKNSKEVKLSNK